MKRIILSCLNTLLLSTLICAQDGSFDSSFGGGDGFTLTPIYEQQHSSGNAVLIQPDGRILVTGASNSEFYGEGVLLRYLENGNPDHSFNGNGKIQFTHPSMHINALASTLEPNGKITTLARLSHQPARDSVALFRFNEDGSPDASFGGDGIVTHDFGFHYQGVYCMLRQPDGKFVIAGYMGQQTDTFDNFFIARLLPNGALDETFSDDGYNVHRCGSTWTNIYDLAIQPDGKILAAGYAWFTGDDDFTIVRYTADGKLDNSFNGDGIYFHSFSPTSDYATGIDIQADGKIVACGTANTNSQNSGTAVVRLDSDGTPDNTFHGDGLSINNMTPYYEQPSAVLIQPDGKILIAGHANTTSQGTHHAAMLRLLPHGIPDQSFNEDGAAVVSISNSSNEITDMAFQEDGRVICIGRGIVGTHSRIGVMRILTGITVGNNSPVSVIHDFQVYPNPISLHSTLTYSLNQPAHVIVQLYDRTGALISTIQNTDVQVSGLHSLPLTLPANLLPGQYIISLTTPNDATAISLVKVE